MVCLNLPITAIDNDKSAMKKHRFIIRESNED